MRTTLRMNWVLIEWALAKLTQSPKLYSKVVVDAKDISYVKWNEIGLGTFLQGKIIPREEAL